MILKIIQNTVEHLLPCAYLFLRGDIPLQPHEAYYLTLTAGPNLTLIRSTLTGIIKLIKSFSNIQRRLPDNNNVQKRL
jgi:hypothetical protein